MSPTMHLDDDCPRQWYAARVTPQTEAAVVAALSAAGMAGWAPTLTRWRGSAADKQKITGPAFPGYVFVSLPEPAANHFGRVLGLPGVRGFLGGAEPGVVSALAISVLQRREAFGHFDETRTRPARTVHENHADRRAVRRMVRTFAPTGAIAA